jgi:hypothetical protein
MMLTSPTISRGYKQFKDERGQKANIVGKPRGKYLARKLGHTTYPMES